MNKKYFQCIIIFIFLNILIGFIVVPVTSLNYQINQNQPPEIPNITGQINGKAGVIYEYNFISVDPEGDNISYYVDWGDKCGGFWIEPHPSGVEATAYHGFALEGTYTINALAVDSHGAESDWGQLEVTMPLSFILILKIFFNSFNLELLFDFIQEFIFIK
jgi:hypothetical protein